MKRMSEPEVMKKGKKTKQQIQEDVEATTSAVAFSKRQTLQQQQKTSQQQIKQQPQQHQPQPQSQLQEQFQLQQPQPQWQLQQQFPQQQFPIQQIFQGDTQPSTSTAWPSISQLSTDIASNVSKPIETSRKIKTELMQCRLKIPRRQNPMRAGTIGKQIRVQTNMFQIIFHDNFVTNAVHYDVDITPAASKALFREIFEKCRATYFSNRFPAYDGKKNAYSANNLPFNDYMMTSIKIDDIERDKNREFTITFKKVANIDLSWLRNLRPGLDEIERNQTGIQVLDIIIRHGSTSQLIPVGRSLFAKKENKREWQRDGGNRAGRYGSGSTEKPASSLGEGLDLRVGTYESVVAGWTPYLNTDASHKGFFVSQKVIDLICELTGTRYPDPRLISKDKEKINKILMDLKVIYTMPGKLKKKRTYRINGLGPNAREHIFKINNTVYTIEQYFAQTKNYNLDYPTLPCIWVGSKKKEEKTYLPAELCVIMEDQPFNKKLNEDQTANMIKYTAKGTQERRQKIMNAFTSIKVNENPTMKNEFHLEIDNKMKEVSARILPAPQIQYDRMEVTVNRGVWRAKKFNQAVRLEDYSWTILNLDENLVDRTIHDFKECLIQQAYHVGMKIGKAVTPFITIKWSEQNIRNLSNYFQENKRMKLIIVVLPNKTSKYSEVKQVTELQVGVLTQCIKTSNLRKCNPAVLGNILLKINSKLNGVNHTFTKTGMPYCLNNVSYMLVGADVSHPSPDARNIPSIAAVAASHDETAFQYNVEVRLQEPKQEIIVDLEEIIFNQITIYNRTTKKLPKRIIYYRDGVSEGQLTQVMHYELGAIKRACEKYKRTKPNFAPEITCLVVQKRHHVRIFPTSLNDSDDKNYNVKAGTIVDTEITHPNHIDFYLVSHASIQGTARPTKYRCICNESNFNEDQIEQLTYYLCHMLARCTRSVSYPAPTYYAHLAAYRGRTWIHNVPIAVDNLAKEQHKKLSIKMSSAPMCFV